MQKQRKMLHEAVATAANREERVRELVVPLVSPSEGHSDKEKPRAPILPRETKSAASGTLH